MNKIKGNSSIPVFKGHQSIEKIKSEVKIQNRGKRINYKRKTKKQQEH